MGLIQDIPIWFVADETSQAILEAREIYRVGRLRQAMHMPRWASRATLIVEEVRVEKLQKISMADAIAEGIHRWSEFLWTATHDSRQVAYADPVCAYLALWNGLHTEPGETWHDNPDVIVTTFTVQQGNLDAIEQAKAALRLSGSSGGGLHG